MAWRHARAWWRMASSCTSPGWFVLLQRQASGWQGGIRWNAGGAPSSNATAHHQQSPSDFIVYKGSCQGGAAARIDSNRQLHCCRASDPTCVPPCLLFTRPWQVWELASGALVQGVPQKQVSREHWPALHWAGDESAFAHCVTNTVHVYSKADNFASKYRAAACSGSGYRQQPAQAVCEVLGQPACWQGQ